MVLESLENLRVNSLCYSESVLVSPAESAFRLSDFNEFVCLCMTYRTLCRRILSFIDIAAYEASEFFF